MWGGEVGDINLKQKIKERIYKDDKTAPNDAEFMREILTYIERLEDELYPEYGEQDDEEVEDDN